MRTGFRDNFHHPGAPLSSFRPSLESSGYRAAASSRPTEAVRFLSTSSPEVSPPSAFPRTGQRLFEGQVFLPGRLASSGFLNPVTPSSAPCLPALFHAGSAPGVSPSKLFPSVQPFAVSDAVALLSLVRLVDQPVPTSPDASAKLHRSRLALPDGPRLQGFAPHESPPLFTGGLDRRRARGSLGFRTLQGFLPRWRSRTFTRPPLIGLPWRLPKQPLPAPLRVSPPTRLACLSRDCRPSWAL